MRRVHFSDQEREGKRPLLFHRWGGLGNHRYEIGFSGDTISVWESLRFQPYFMATAANVAYAHWSHDIGGHIPGVVDPEPLYARAGSIVPMAPKMAWSGQRPLDPLIIQIFPGLTRQGPPARSMRMREMIADIEPGRQAIQRSMHGKWMAP